MSVAGPVNTGDEPRWPAPSLITRFPLPSRVSVWAEGRWRRAWLIARSHEPSGWIGIVQYDDDRGREITAEIPSERITTADTWLTDEGPARHGVGGAGGA
jgi:hypothetical protein